MPDLVEQWPWLAEYGLWGLAAFAFLGATLFPVSSEIAVVAALKLGYGAWPVFLCASAGNALGAWLNYGIGSLFADTTSRRLSGSRSGRKALEWVQKYGWWSLLGSWLPVVGDPLCLAAGVFRFSKVIFSILGIGTRLARYGIIILLFQSGV